LGVLNGRAAPGSEPIDLTTINSDEPLLENQTNELMETVVSDKDSGTPTNWWDNGFSTNCSNCLSESIVIDDKSGFTCWSYYSKSLIVKPCCDSSNNPNSFFSVSVDTKNTICPKCNTDMLHLSCCKAFVSVQIIDDKHFKCAKCDKHFMLCFCKNFNPLPSPAIVVINRLNFSKERLHICAIAVGVRNLNMILRLACGNIADINVL